MLCTTADYALVAVKGALLLRPVDGGKLKIAPKTPLFFVSGGKVDEAQDPALALGRHVFKFARAKDSVVFDKTVTTIGDVIKSSAADRIYGAAAFTKGVPPPTFLFKTPRVYMPTGDSKATQEAALAAAGKCAGKIDLLWEVQCVQGRIQPKGLALVTRGQITMKSGQDLDLQPTPP